MGKLKDLHLMNDIEIEVDWEYGQRYNAAGEWNPRLVYSEKTGEYVEPDEIEEGES